MKELREMVVGVVMGGESGEREVSLKSGRAVRASLSELGCKSVEVVVDRDMARQLLAAEIDLAFLILHGGWGEGGQVQGLCEMLSLPYTGSGMLASALAMNKAMSKEYFKLAEIQTPAFCLVADERAGLSDTGLEPPLVVKPNCEGSTLGVSIVREEEEFQAALKRALEYGEALVEEFIEGREVTVGALDGQPLGVVEVVPKSGFYDYESKYTPGRAKYIAPAELSLEEEELIREWGRLAYEQLGCKGAARVDFRLHPERGPFALEVNTIPGMTETSLLPMSASVYDISYVELVERILKGALKK